MHRKMARSMPALSALLDEQLRSHMCTTPPAVAGRWHREMPAYHSSGLRTWRMAALNTAAALLLAALASIGAAPLLLRHRPAGYPVGKTSIAIIRSRCRGGQSHAAVALARAALAMVRAAPSLLAHAPAGLPVAEAISTVVGVGRRRR